MRNEAVIMVRKFKPSDLEQVMKIWLETNIAAHDFVPEKYWRDNFDAVKEVLPKAEVYVYECDCDKSIGGFVGLNSNFIEGLFVRYDLQSQGIGKQLLDSIKSVSSRLELSVYRKNGRAVKFYKREGFAVQSELVDEYTGEKECIMFWNIS